MCILFIFADPEPKEDGYRFIVASNRDEYYERPAAPIAKIADTHIIGGSVTFFLIVALLLTCMHISKEIFALSRRPGVRSNCWFL